ncbi:hypothetical protein BGZ81_002872 [Podila clonocystis]|nr:hypothetical protein BGZ81_002872 [Podila clonocystis]
MESLLQVYSIDHPDEINKEQQRKLQDAKQEILELQEGCSDMLASTSESPKTQDDNSESEVKKDRITVQHVSSHDDYEEYFSHSAQIDCSHSGDESHSGPILSKGSSSKSEQATNQSILDRSKIEE